MKKDPNKFYFDDYIDGKNFKHEEAEKQFLKVFPIGSDVDEVMKKIKEGEKGWSCGYKDYNDPEYVCSRDCRFLNKDRCFIGIETLKNSKKLNSVNFTYRSRSFFDV